VAVTRPSRKQARRDAAFVLYQHDVTGSPLAALLDALRGDEGYAADEFTLRCTAGVLADREKIDALIEAHSENWTLDRLAPLERNILRLAVFELRAGETPPEVAIDEAVRLAKRYSSNEAGGLVNGILAGVWRALQEGAAEDERDERGREDP